MGTQPSGRLVGLGPGSAFCLLTFALTWPVAWLAALAKLNIIEMKIPGRLQMLASLSPGIAALIMSLGRFDGAGVAHLLRQLLRWRMKPGIYFAAAVFSIGAWLLT